jgi:hypothetical protein
MSRSSAADRPAEAINDSDDGIQEIKQPPFVRNNVTAEAYRRNEESELHNKWDDVAEIPEFFVESRQKQARTEGCIIKSSKEVPWKRAFRQNHEPVG